MRRIGLLLLPGFQVIGLAAFSAFEVANKEAGERLYGLHILSEDGRPVRASLGTELVAEPMGQTGFDTLLVGMGMEVEPASPAVIAFLQRAARETRRLAAICLAAFVLGDAGLLDGRRATTHWLFAQRFKARYPNVTLDIDRIFIEDGTIWTSAGMSAAIDLVVGMIERDHGSELARRVARGLVMHHRRSGGQSQHSALLDLDSPNDRVQTVLAYAKRNLRRSLGLDELAEIACLSRRQFTRLFRAETGTTPARAVELLRLEAAQLLIEQSRLPIDEIAREAGFGNRERMRRAFVRSRGEAPRAIRAVAGPVASLQPGQSRTRAA